MTLKLVDWSIELVCINKAHSVSLSKFSDLGLDTSWFDQPCLSNKVGNDSIFGFSEQQTQRISSTIQEAPNVIRLMLTDYMTKKNYKPEVIPGSSFDDLLKDFNIN